jgi:small subunit ribosomal protein S19
MAKKELTYRGLTSEELQKLPHEEMLKLLTARGRRSLKRGLDEQQSKLLERVEQAKLSGDLKKAIRTHSRDMLILPEMVGLKFAVYNGKEFTEFETTLEMVGHFLGEFALCRRPVKHSAPGVGATRSSLFVPVK